LACFLLLNATSESFQQCFPTYKGTKMNNSNSKIPDSFTRKPIAHAMAAQVDYVRLISLLPLCLATSAMAAETVQDQPKEETVVLEKVIVTSKFPSFNALSTTEMEADILTSKRAAVSDTAKLLEDTPGVSLYGAGGVSSLPVIHGLNDDRVKININGMTLTSACANHMNPPLSYIDRSNIGKITILSGVTPVSVGGDSIGGTISVQTPEPVFAEPGKDICWTATPPRSTAAMAMPLAAVSPQA
jgi:iron complex outermembrane receptor protein